MRCSLECTFLLTLLPLFLPLCLRIEDFALHESLHERDQCLDRWFMKEEIWAFVHIDHGTSDELDAADVQSELLRDLQCDPDFSRVVLNHTLRIFE